MPLNRPEIDVIDRHPWRIAVNAGLICVLLCTTVSCLSRKADPHCAVVDAPQLFALSNAWANVTEDGSVKWSRQVLGCKMGPYLVYVPISNNKAERPNIMVLRGTTEGVLYVMGTSYSIWEDNRPVVTVDDNDNDGSFDSLTYSIYYEGFADELQIVDQNLDGQPDYRARFRAGEDVAMWLWVEDGWYEKVKGGRLVLVNGVETPYERSNGHFVFSRKDGQRD